MFAIGTGCSLIPFFSFSSCPPKSIAIKDIYKIEVIEFVSVMKISKEFVPADIPILPLFSAKDHIFWGQILKM